MVIAETFDLSIEHSKKYFAYKEMQMSKSKKRVFGVDSSSIKKRYKMLKTDKMHVKNTKMNLANIAGTKNKNIVPREIQNKISIQLGKK